MKSLIELIADKVGEAFEKAGYDRKLAMVKHSDRPDLAEFQSNGAMAGAKQYRKAPFSIAEEVVDILKEDNDLSEVQAVNPGFINIRVSEEFLCAHLKNVAHTKKFGVSSDGISKKIIIDYGGANIAKPLHVGHLRSAIIGESLKRILRYSGAEVISDVHLGDWGMPMGLIIAYISEEKPELEYFNPDHTGSYPKEAPFSISELEEIYPKASARSKEDEVFHSKAMEFTKRLQAGDKGVRALWRHIMNVSGSDLKKNYARLGASFDLWRGESDADPAIKTMVDEFKRKNLAYESNGALIVDVEEEGDTRTIPPCIILKSDGAALYATSDLATIEQRMSEFEPEEMVYVVDKRQELHFIQVFRAAGKARLVFPETRLSFVGFGTMNGNDGKPFKTRDGGVPRLENLMDEIKEKMLERINSSGHDISDEEKEDIADKVSLAALKYADLSNQPSKDYVFDPEKFTAFEGNTGPYLLYTIVRIKSILQKAENSDKSKIDIVKTLAPSRTVAEKNLALKLCGFAEAVETAAKELAPNRLSSFLYELTTEFNTFYHETKILSEKDDKVREGYLGLLALCLKELEAGIALLGFESPDKM